MDPLQFLSSLKSATGGRLAPDAPDLPPSQPWDALIILGETPEHFLVVGALASTDAEWIAQDSPMPLDEQVEFLRTVHPSHREIWQARIDENRAAEAARAKDAVAPDRVATKPDPEIVPAPISPGIFLRRTPRRPAAERERRGRRLGAVEISRN